MRYFSLFFYFLIFSSVFLETRETLALTLPEAFKKALSHREVHQKDQIQIQIENERLSRTKKYLLPSLSATSEHLFRHETTDSSEVVERVIGEGYQHTGKITAEQPIYSGGAAWHAISRSQKQTEIANLEKKNSQLSTFSSLAETYLQVLAAQKDFENLQLEQKVLTQQIGTLSVRSRIGQSSKTDLLTTQSQKARVEAELSALQGTLNLRMNQLSRLIGPVKSEEIKEGAASVDLEALDVPKDWHTHLEDHPSLQKVRVELEISEKDRRIAGSEHLPQVDLTANYFFDRSGLLEDSKWDATLSLSLNIFEGGRIQSLVREQALVSKQKELDYRQQRRDLTAAWEQQKISLENSLLQVKKLQTAANYARRSSRESHKDFSRGLISNLDLLRNVEAHSQVRRLLDQAKYQAKIDWYKLMAASGVLP